MINSRETSRLQRRLVINRRGIGSLTGWVGELQTECHPRCVGRTPYIPPVLARGAFTLAEARDAGLTNDALTGKTWHRLGNQLYRSADAAEDPWLTLSAWRRLLPPETVFVGATAAWLFGLKLEPTNPVEVAVPKSYGHRSRAGLVVCRDKIPPAEVVSKRGLRATSLPRTLLGLCLRRPAVEALVALDMAVRARLTDATALINYAKGRGGAKRLRLLAPLAAPAESPMETRLRWLLIQAGLPHPEVQTELCGGAFRADLYYPQARLVLEYDGGNHRERLVEDDQRQNRLVTAGFHVLRFTATDVYRRPAAVVSDVRAALG